MKIFIIGLTITTFPFLQSASARSYQLKETSIKPSTRTMFCYSARPDVDKDGYAYKGAPAVKLIVPSYNYNNCPTGYVPAAGDCNDKASSIHPNRLEIAFNNIDDNCNSRIDENEYITTAMGNGSSSYLRINVKVNSKEVYETFNKGTQIEAKVLYKKTNVLAPANYTDYKLVHLGTKYDSLVGSYFGTSIILNNLTEGTSYSSIVKFFKFENEKIGHKYIGESGTWYNSVTRKNNDTLFDASRKIAMRGYYEKFLQSIGKVGVNGSQYINGTKYSAPSYSRWDTYFYSYIANTALDSSIGIGTAPKLKEYFDNYGLHYSIKFNQDLLETTAKLGDWIGLNYQGTEEPTSSAMFISFDPKSGYVTMLKGDHSNKVVISYVHASKVVSLGSVDYSILK